jgi:hypothetical protein
VASSRWMLFVDGENMTLRGQAFASAAGIPLPIGPHYVPDVFLWIPELGKKQDFVKLWRGYGLAEVPVDLETHAIRAHYYTSVAGDADLIRRVEEALWALGFTPHVFKKIRKSTKSKGVDIARVSGGRPGGRR